MKESAYGRGPALPDPVGFPALYFFAPELLFRLRGDQLEIGLAEGGAAEAEALLREILSVRPASWQDGTEGESAGQWDRDTDRTAYIRTVQALKAHLFRGNAYEINFCTGSFLRDVRPDPIRLFDTLNRLSPAPFAALYRTGNRFLASASPERFLQRTGDVVISQPMKGTASRDADPTRDEAARQALLASPKERSENIMAVDLSRNDLARTAVPGTVRVRELCGAYRFPQVHQLISTVSARVNQGMPDEAVLEAAFPMASMTGAPKHRVLSLIDRYETSARGIYSGALGYFSPGDGFDFSVVIRSIAGNLGAGTLSFHTGSGITVYADPAREWEECLLKGAALNRAVAMATAR